MITTLIFGGTFDPIHFGHLRSARALLDLFSDAHMVMIPCKIPSHRPQPVANGKHRLNMLNMAVQNDESITVDDCELSRDGKSYTFDTLKMYRKRRPDDRLYFVLGSDAWVTLHTWYRWKELINFAHFLVLNRSGDSSSETTALKVWSEEKSIELTKISNRAGNIVNLKLDQIEISATKVRGDLLRGKSVDNCVPSNVVDYIYANRLYRKSHLNV